MSAYQERTDAWIKTLHLQEQASAGNAEENKQFIYGVEDGYHHFAAVFAHQNDAWAITEQSIRALAEEHYKDDKSATESLKQGFCAGYLVNMQTVIRRWKEHG